MPNESPASRVRFPDVVVDLQGLSSTVRIFKAARDALHLAGASGATLQEFRDHAFGTDNAAQFIDVVESWVVLHNLGPHARDRTSAYPDQERGRPAETDPASMPPPFVIRGSPTCVEVWTCARIPFERSSTRPWKADLIPLLRTATSGLKGTGALSGTYATAQLGASDAENSLFTQSRTVRIPSGNGCDPVGARPSYAASSSVADRRGRSGIALLPLRALLRLAGVGGWLDPGQLEAGAAPSTWRRLRAADVVGHPTSAARRRSSCPDLERARRHSVRHSAHHPRTGRRTSVRGGCERTDD